MKYIRLITIPFLALFLFACKTTPPMQPYQGIEDKQIFDRGERNLAKRNYEQAAKDFEGLDTLYPFGQYSQQGQLNIIYSYYKSDNPELALLAADRYIRLYPRSPDVDYAYYMKGLINLGEAESWYKGWAQAKIAQRDLSSQEEAFQDFKIFIERFPKSKYVPDAHKRMLYIRNLLAEHQLNVSKYYMRHRAYVAAVNRAKLILESYPGAPQVIPALKIMVEAYQALGEKALADATLEVLRKNYPESH